MKNSIQAEYKNLTGYALKFFILSLIIVLFFLNSIYAGPFLKIDRIDSDSEFPKIKVFLTIRDHDKGAVTGLDEGNIYLYEDGFMVNYTRVKALTENDGILYMVLGIDSSKSISEKLLKEVKKSADDFLTHIGSKDLIALYRFNDEVIFLNNFTNNRAELAKNINDIERHGTKTLLYNAIYDAIGLLKKTGAPRKAIIVFTDGKDEGSSIEINDVIESAKENSIPIYCVSFNPQDRVKLLTRLSLLTGGQFFNSGKKDINAIYKAITGNVKHQYLAEYKSMLTPDGKSHSIEAKLKYGDLRDTDQANFTVKKDKWIIWLPYVPEKILLILVLILIFIIIIILAFFSKNIYKILKMAPNTPASAAPVYSEQERKEGTVKEADKQTEENGNGEKISEHNIKAWLTERDGVDAGRKIPIQYEETIIGRDKENHVVIDDRSVSKKHAKIKVIKNSFYLFDMASDKGTYLNENKLLRPKLLYDWDEIRVGKRIFIFRISNVA